MSSDGEKAKIMLTTALEMEEKGKNYYDQAARTSKNPLGREVYEMLAGYEVLHMNRIREIYDALTGGRGWSRDVAAFAVVTDLGEAFRKLARKHEAAKADADDVKALEVGIEFESVSLKFYEDHLALAEDETEKKFVGAMAAEERGHLNLLTDLKYYYTDPEGWLMEKGRAGLDGA